MELRASVETEILHRQRTASLLVALSAEAQRGEARIQVGTVLYVHVGVLDTETTKR